MTKVLLVEDDNNLREIYEARLAAEGYDIVTAKDGEEALEVAKQHRPELIISDVMMPRISGFEMLDILRTTNGLKDAKVIMLTALGQAEDKARADHLGADRYLVKSQVTLEDIVNAADELLNGVEEPTEAPVATPAAPPSPTPPPPAAPAAPATPAVDHATPSLTITEPAPQPTAFATQTAPAEQTQTPPVATVETIPQVVDTPSPMPTIPLTDTPEPVLPTPGTTVVADPVVTQPVQDVAAPADPVVTQPVQDVAAPADPVVVEPVQEITVTEAGEIPVIELPELGVKQESEPESPDNPVTLQMPQNPDSTIVNEAQTSTDEEAAIEQQIEQFIHTESVMPEGVNPQPVTENVPAESTPAEESANASIINSAVEQLNSNQVTEPSPAPEPAPAVAAQTPNDTINDSQISGKKMIQPVSAPENKADLATLVAQEEMAANAEKGITGAAVVADVSAPVGSTPPLAVTTDAPTPGGVFTPNSGGSAQSNAL